MYDMIEILSKKIIDLHLQLCFLAFNATHIIASGLLVVYICHSTKIVKPATLYFPISH